MQSSLRIGLMAAMTVLIFWLAGCFTEVGNAEDDRLVEANFKVDYRTDGGPLPKASAGKADSAEVIIDRFYLNVREAEFHLLDTATGISQEFHLWKEASAALPVDFTGKDSRASLPVQKVGKLDPELFTLECTLPMRSILRPDTLDVAGFAENGYIKGTVLSGGDLTPFLFALPKANGELNLVYAPDVLKEWYTDGVYHCQFVFFAKKWVAGVDFSAAAKVRGKNGESLILLDPEHNAVLHQALAASFYQSFNCSQVNQAYQD